VSLRTPARGRSAVGFKFIERETRHIDELIITKAAQQEEDMGLLDIINGIQNGPRGPSGSTNGRSSNSASKGGGMSPIMTALLGLLAYKAVKGIGSQSSAPVNSGAPGPLTSGGAVKVGNSGGGIGDVLGGLLGGKPGGSVKDLIPGGIGGLLSGAGAGTALSGGLGNLIKEFQNGGHGRTVQSWIDTGPNEKIAPKDLASVLGSDTLNALSQQTGVGREELLAGLSQHLPNLIDQLTPNGRLPSEQEAARMV
jgi:uncharacterized protein YidB (DUF937 family)